MLAMIRQVFAPPVFEDEDKTRIAGLFNKILLSFFAVLIAMGIATPIISGDVAISWLIVAGLAVLVFGARALMRSGRVLFASALFLSVLWVAFTVLIVLSGGIGNVLSIIYTEVTVMAGLLLGRRGGMIAAGASSAAGLGMLYMENTSRLPPPLLDATTSIGWLTVTFCLFIAAITLSLATRGLNEALGRTRCNERDLAESNEVLDAIRTSLQERNEHLQTTVQEYDTFMAQVGEGNLADRLSLNGNGRQGNDPLVKLGHRLNETVASLRDVVAQIRDAATALGAQAGEILATTTQQASGATEQSAAISQATTTVDEIRTIAEQLVSRSRTVADAAQRTVEVSRAGQEMSRETIAGMAQIKARVDVIEENILALSERTLQIGEIIDSVNHIASQSNMLALNASVEAARAGEQGKGFAVVAQEVRDLADRSREATAQVKAILSDVQKATASTAMATEEGKKGVDAGVELVSQMQDAIEQLSAAIGESAQSATQMVAGGQQQTSGMEQIAVAMQNINQVTVQSLSSTRQAEHSAQELHDLALSLAEIVEQYQV